MANNALPNKKPPAIIVKKTIFPRKDIWYTTDWQEYCSYVGDLHLVDLRNILKEAFRRKPSIEKSFLNFSKGISYDNASKRLICSFISIYTPEKIAHNCHNPTTLDGEDFGYFDKEEVVYWKEGNQNYCFTVDELEKLNKNPYTNTLFGNKKDLLKGKRKPIQEWDKDPKMRFNPDSSRAEYKYNKALISQEIAKKDLLPIPYELLEGMTKNELITKFKPYISDIDMYKDRLTMLMHLYTKLLIPSLNGIISLLNNVGSYDESSDDESSDDESSDGESSDDEFDPDDYDMVWESLSNNATTLSRASPHLRRDYSIVRQAVIYFGGALRYAPAFQGNEEIVRLAVQNDGEALQFASRNLQGNEEIVRLALQDNGKALRFAPDFQGNEEIVRLAVQNNGDALRYTPAFQDNEEIVRLALQNNGHALQFAPDFQDNEEIVRLALQNDGYALQFAPAFQGNEEIVRLAVQTDGYALGFAPAFQGNEEIVKLAVQNNGDALRYAPAFQGNEEIVRLAVQHSGFALRSAPAFQGNEEIVRLAVQTDGEALQYAPAFQDNEEIVRLAVQNDVDAFRFASQRLRQNGEIRRLVRLLSNT